MPPLRITLAAGVFARRRPRYTPSGPARASSQREVMLAQLDSNRDCRDVCNCRAMPVNRDHFPHTTREPAEITSHNRLSSRFDRSHIVLDSFRQSEQRGLLRRMRVADLLDPLYVTLLSTPSLPAEHAGRTQQELGQPVARGATDLLGRLPRPDKIAQCFLKLSSGTTLQSDHRSGDCEPASTHPAGRS